MREIIHLACEECSRRNYHTTKNKKNHPAKFTTNKYCKFCKKHTSHKEAKL
jgi:large subunit ribosomal protein L33